jgi:hypothetical protein
MLSNSSLIVLIFYLSLGHLGFKAFLFHMRANDYYYVSLKLARRTYSLTVHRTLRGAAISLHAHWSVIIYLLSSVVLFYTTLFAAVPYVPSVVQILQRVVEFLNYEIL